MHFVKSDIYFTAWFRFRLFFAVHKCWWNLVWLAHKKVMDCSRRKPMLCRCDSVRFWAKLLRCGWIYRFRPRHLIQPNNTSKIVILICRQKPWWARWWKKPLFHWPKRNSQLAISIKLSCKTLPKPKSKSAQRKTMWLVLLCPFSSLTL